MLISTHTKHVFATLPTGSKQVEKKASPYQKFGFPINGSSRLSGLFSRSHPPRTSHHRLFQDSHDSSGFEWRSGVASANAEEIPRPLLWGASRDSLRDQDESSIIADSMIAQSFHYLPLRPVVCVLVRCRRRRCLPHDPKSCSRRASRRRAWRRRCSRWHVPLALPGTVLRICSSVVGSVCVCLLARLLRRVAPRFSCPCLFVGLVLVRARWVIASG